MQEESNVLISTKDENQQASDILTFSIKFRILNP